MRWLAAIAALFLALTANAAPRIAIIIDDIGYRWTEDRQVLGLPSQIAVAVIPDSPHGTRMAALAVGQQREVLVHVPMQALADNTNAQLLGDAGLHVGATEQQVREYLAQALQLVPGATGVNNHMGSRLTQQVEPMRWLMRALACHRNLYFIDSYTTAQSVALSEAQRAAIPATRRHVFLDNDPNPVAVDRQIQRLLQMAEQRGFAVAIGHPLPATLAALEQLSAQLEARGIELVAPGALVRVEAVSDNASAD